MILKLSGVPNPRQAEFFCSKARHTAYGGARGGGKSWAMRRKLVLLCLYYSGLNCLLLRRTLPELRENHVIPLLKELKDVAQYNSTERVFRFLNGSRIKLGYCDGENDVYQYQGQEYDVVGMEEATHFTEEQMRFLTTCNRTVRMDFSPRMYYTCNPGNVGHGWVKRLFIDKRYHDGENPDDYAFIPARVWDNHVLMSADPDYVRQLRSLPEDLRRAYLDGDWDVHAGQYFREFSRDMHVIAPVRIPAWWKRFRSMDWGYNDPCCVLWHAVDGDGRIYTYRELYVRCVRAEEVARRIKELTGDEYAAYTVASPDMWQKRGALLKSEGGFEGESIAEIFALCGVPLTPADNSRVAGWQRLRAYLAPAADGLARWQTFECCRELIRTLPLLVFDPHNREDVADGEDHAPEALRYALMSRPGLSVKRYVLPPKPYDPLRTDEPKPDFWTL
ncbi:MAG: phage terminase large subunit [Clostridia bacterium]